MTFLEDIKKRLIDSGLSDSEADEVLKLAETDKVLISTFKGRWTDDTDGYPPMMTGIVWMCVKKVVLEWINVSCPQAWFKSLFI